MPADTKDNGSTRKIIGAFAAASFLHDVGADMVFSVWPLFLTEVLGVSKSVLGIIDGLGDALVSISQAISGYLSDRMRKRKVFIWLGYLFGAVARIGYALAPTWQWIVPFRILDRSGKMRGSPRDAMVSDLSNHQNRGRHFGVLRAMDNLGAVTGIVLGILLLPLLNYRNMFLVAAIPSMLATITVLWLVRERRDATEKLFPGIRLGDFSPNVRLFFFLSALFELGSFSYSFLLLGAREAGWATGAVPVLYLLFTVVAALTSLPIGRLSDLLGRKLLIGFGFVCWMGVALIFLTSLSVGWMLLAFVLYGCSRAALDTVQRAFVAELAPKQFLGSTLGGFQLIVGLFSLPASLIAGLLWDTYGIAAPFTFALGMGTIALVLLFFIRETR